MDMFYEKTNSWAKKTHAYEMECVRLTGRPDKKDCQTRQINNENTVDCTCSKWRKLIKDVRTHKA